MTAHTCHHHNGNDGFWDRLEKTEARKRPTRMKVEKLFSYLNLKNFPLVTSKYLAEGVVNNTWVIQEIGQSNMF